MAQRQNPWEAFFNRAWYQHSHRLCWLRPLSRLFGWLVARRRRNYQTLAQRQWRAPVPVLVVGNISVGGTGKTPFVIALARALTARGFSPGIVSRGYRAQLQNFPAVVDWRKSGAAELYGDEPCLLAEESGCPVVIDPDRAAAARYLLNQAPNINVILSDDGLQHYALGRDLEILLLDGERGLGNGRLLPEGPLREPLQRLFEVDWCISNGPLKAQGLLAGDQQASVLKAIDYEVELAPRGWRQVATDKRHPLTPMPFDPAEGLYALTGIANPERFFQSLRQLGFNPNCISFADHHRFQAADFAMLKETDTVLMTGKDAVKCSAFSTHNFWQLDVEMVLPEAFLQALLTKLKSLPKSQGKAIGE